MSQEIAAVDAMLRVMDGVALSVSKIREHELGLLASEADSLCDGRAPISDAAMVADACQSAEGFRRLLSMAGRLKDEAAATTSQLSALRIDLSQGAIARDSAAAFIDLEFLYVESLGEAADALLAEQGRLAEGWARWKVQLPMER